MASTEHGTEGGDVFDVVVLGGGPVGENVAQYAVEGGLRAVLVDAERFGGECAYWACVPSRALLRPVTVVGAGADLEGMTPGRLEPEALLRRRDTWVSGYGDAGQVAWAHEAGITTVRGHGRLVGEREVAVEGEDGPRRLRARRAVVVATGSRPYVPDTYRDALPWGSRDATGLREVPASLLVVGGGVVACEAAT